MASAVYPKGIAHIMAGDCDLDGVAVKSILVPTGAYNAAHEVLGDLASPIGSGVALTNKTLGVVGTGVFDADNVTFPSVAAGSTAYGTVTYYDGATKYLLAYNELTAPQITFGGNITVEWDAGGIFSL